MMDDISHIRDVPRPADERLDFGLECHRLLRLIDSNPHIGAKAQSLMAHAAGTFALAQALREIGAILRQAASAETKQGTP